MLLPRVPLTCHGLSRAFADGNPAEDIVRMWPCRLARLTALRKEHQHGEEGAAPEAVAGDDVVAQPG